jgi:hypothetical protein
MKIKATNDSLFTHPGIEVIISYNNFHSCKDELEHNFKVYKKNQKSMLSKLNDFNEKLQQNLSNELLTEEKKISSISVTDSSTIDTISTMDKRYYLVITIS